MDKCRLSVCTVIKFYTVELYLERQLVFTVYEIIDNHCASARVNTVYDDCCMKHQHLIWYISHDITFLVSKRRSNIEYYSLSSGGGAAVSVSSFTKWMRVSYLIALAGSLGPGIFRSWSHFTELRFWLHLQTEPWLSGAPPAQITRSHIMAPVYLLSNLPIFHFSPSPRLLLELSRSAYQRGKSINLATHWLVLVQLSLVAY